MLTYQASFEAQLFKVDAFKESIVNFTKTVEDLFIWTAVAYTIFFFNKKI